MILIPPVIPLQTAEDVRRIVSTNDATAQGILIGVCLLMVSAVIVLYRENRNMQKEYVDTMKEVHLQLIKVNDNYNEFVRIMYRNEKGV